MINGIDWWLGESGGGWRQGSCWPQTNPNSIINIYRLYFQIFLLCVAVGRFPIQLSQIYHYCHERAGAVLWTDLQKCRGNFHNIRRRYLLCRHTFFWSLNSGSGSPSEIETLFSAKFCCPLYWPADERGGLEVYLVHGKHHGQGAALPLHLDTYSIVQ